MNRATYWKFHIHRLTVWVYPFWWVWYNTDRNIKSIGPLTWLVRPKT